MPVDKLLARLKDAVTRANDQALGYLEYKVRSQGPSTTTSLESNRWRPRRTPPASACHRDCCLKAIIWDTAWHIKKQLEHATQISLTDPDARATATSNSRGLVGYNVQTAVEPKHHLIVALERFFGDYISSLYIGDYSDLFSRNHPLTARWEIIESKPFDIFVGPTEINGNAK